MLYDYNNRNSLILIKIKILFLKSKNPIITEKNKLIRNSNLVSYERDVNINKKNMLEFYKFINVEIRGNIYTLQIRYSQKEFEFIVQNT